MCPAIAAGHLDYSKSSITPIGQQVLNILRDHGADSRSLLGRLGFDHFTRSAFAVQKIELPIFPDALRGKYQSYTQADLGALRSTGAPPARLKIELTESVVADNIDEVTGKMRQLKAHGVAFALDDFGTGYSSLVYLKHLPLDQLKIDRSFVRDVLTDPSDATIARIVVTLARELSLSVIAEGVETAAERDFLSDSGIFLMQGYLLERPVFKPLASL